MREGIGVQNTEVTSGDHAEDYEPFVSELLTSPPPVISEREAQDIAREMYGLAASAHRLTSERDLNFRLQNDNGTCCVLKVTNPAEDPSVTNLQTEALLHIQRVAPDLPVPRVFETLTGEHEIRRRFGGLSESTIRILTYLQGEPLHRVARSSTQRRDVAKNLARLGLALKDFRHPAAEHDLLWDTKHASRLRPLARAIDDERLRGLVEQQLDIFDRNVVPVLGRLRSQVVHNDLNPHNVLVDPADHDRVSGILDFGDMVWTPLVIDVAVAASYQIGDQSDPLSPVAEFVSAYHGVSPLEREEIAVLFDLIAARLFSTVAITNWRALRHPENREYILRNHARAVAGLEAFARLRRDDAERIFLRACGLE